MGGDRLCQETRAAEAPGSGPAGGSSGTEHRPCWLRAAGNSKGSPGSQVPRALKHQGAHGLRVRVTGMLRRHIWARGAN